MNQSSVIVTGAAGFIGSHLCSSLLERGYRVIGIDNFDAFYDQQIKRRNVAGLARGFELAEADIRDQARLREIFRAHRPAAAFHLAALAGVRPSIDQPLRYADVNIAGTVSVLEAAKGAGCSKIIFASSSSVYGNNRKIPFGEEDPVEEPVSPYAATKRAGELTCRVYSRLCGMSIAALRLFTVFGPAQRPDLAISKFMRAIARGEDIQMFGDGATSRDYTYIADIIDGVLRAHDRLTAADDSFFRIYNLGNSHPVSLKHMIESIERVVGRSARIRHMPLQTGDVQHTCADLTRATAELGFCPATSFEDGLALQWNWLCSQPEMVRAGAQK